jgi:hypothetical protein
MTRRKAIERWETKVGNCEVTPQVLWGIAKLLTKRNEPEPPTAVHGTLRIIYHPKEKANAIADYLENQFASNDMCDENHERRVETRVEALLASVDDTLSAKVRPCAIH